MADLILFSISDGVIQKYDYHQAIFSARCQTADAMAILRRQVMSENTLPSIPQDDESEPALDDSFRLTLAVTSNAPSNGQATNSATAYLSRHGVPQSHQRIDFEVTGSARFTNGTSFFSLQTDAQGKATVFFVDNRPEGVVVISSFRNSFAFKNTDFRANLPAISVEVWANDSPADGVSANQLLYLVYDSITSETIGNAIIDFNVISGQGQLSAPTGITSPDGNFLLSVTKSGPGMVSVGAQLRGYPNVNNYTQLNFNERQPRYRLTAEVFPRTPAGHIFVTYTLIDLNTGRGVPNRQLRIYLNCGVEQTFTSIIGPTGPDGRVSAGWVNRPGVISYMLAVLAGDATVNAPFTLVF